MTQADLGHDGDRASPRDASRHGSRPMIGGALYLIRFLQVHESFRKPELDALAQLSDVSYEIVDYNDSSPFCIVKVASDAGAAALVRRSVLCTGIWSLWGHAPTYDALKSYILSSEATLALLAKHKNSSFRFDVDCFQGKRSDASRRELMESLAYLPLNGRIAMRNPDLHFTIFEEYTQVPAAPVHQPSSHLPSDQGTSTGSKSNKIPDRVFLGALVGTSDRDAVSLYDLKRRAYISTTSMDANLALVTANLALAGPGKVAYDPFMGTGGFPLACAHFGAHVMGSDIDGRSVRGKGRKPGGKGAAADKSVAGNFRQYGTHGRYLDGFIGDLTNTPLRVPGTCTREAAEARWLDAVVCDPPYGVREGLKTLGSVKPGQGLVPVRLADGQMAHLAPDYIPPKRPYSFDALQLDILNFAVRTLVDGGRLCMWLPTANEPDPETEPEHSPDPDSESAADSTHEPRAQHPASPQTEATATAPAEVGAGHRVRAAARRIPMHPGLCLVSVCAQDFSKWSRKLLTYERRVGDFADVLLGDSTLLDLPIRDVPIRTGKAVGSHSSPAAGASTLSARRDQVTPGDGSSEAAVQGVESAAEQGRTAQGVPSALARGRADDLNSFRKKYFQGFK